MLFTRGILNPYKLILKTGPSSVQQCDIVIFKCPRRYYITVNYDFQEDIMSSLHKNNSAK